MFEFNSHKLMGKIAERGENRGSMGKAIGTNRDTFSRKVKSGTFTLKEAYKMFEHLGINKDEAIEILLAEEKQNIEKYIL